MIVDFIKEETPHGPPASMRLSPEVVEKELRQAGFTHFEINAELLPEQYVLIASE